MLLVELTINGTLNRISLEGHNLVHAWDSKILKFSSPQLRTEKTYGGYAEMKFGIMELAPDLFDSADWPAPFSCPVVVKYTEDTEANAETLFSGTCHLLEIKSESVKYAFYGESDDTIISSGEVFNNTLINIASFFCDPARLNLTLDSTFARVSSPTVDHTTSGDQNALKLLSDITAFFSHLFYIEGTTLYLVDMLIDNGSRTITEYDFFPSRYEMSSPVSTITSGDFTRASIYPYGSTQSITTYATVQAQIETALDNILLISNKFRCRLRLPFIGNIPAIGEKISWEDTSLVEDTNAFINARTVQYDFSTEEIIIDGEGILS